jgi:hypothetical protein
MGDDGRQFRFFSHGPPARFSPASTHEDILYRTNVLVKKGKNGEQRGVYVCEEAKEAVPLARGNASSASSTA